jgi:N-acetyl-beta-hexosaminidase
MLAVAEMAWSARDVRDWDDFLARVKAVGTIPPASK